MRNQPVMRNYRVLVTGSRDWTDREVLMARLDESLDAALRAGMPMVLVHGACPKGADNLADQWARLRDVTTEPHPADWSKGHGAGYARNKEMVDLGADICLAFMMPCSKPSCRQQGFHPSHGTFHCASLAAGDFITTEHIWTGVNA